MGKISFEIDPQARNKSALQNVINQFKALPGSDRFLTVPTGNQTILLTDVYGDSYKTITPGNARNLNAYEAAGTPVRGLSQENGTPAIYLAVPPVDAKPILHVFIHEVAHRKWHGFGKGEPHQPPFYKLLNDTLKAFGLTPNFELDLNKTNINSLPSPAGNSNVLDYYRYEKKGELVDDIDVFNKNDKSYWSIKKTTANNYDFLKYDSSGTKIIDKVQMTIATNGLTAHNDYNISDGSYVRNVLDVDRKYKWETKTQYIDSNKKITQTELIYADGSYDAIQHNPYVTDDISTTTYHFDANGKAISSLVVHDDGRREYYKSDLYKKYAWDLESESFDSSGHKIERQIIADDGTRKIERFSMSSTNGFVEPNNPSKIEYYGASGNLIRFQYISYGVNPITNNNVVLKIGTYDNANTGFWNGVEQHYNKSHQLIDVYTIYDNGARVSGIDGAFFTNKWDFSSTVDSNAIMKDFNPYAHFDSDKSSSFDIPYLSNFNPIDQFSLNYTGYKGLDFTGIASTDPYQNIYLISDNPYDYIDYADPSRTYGPIILDLNGDGVSILALGHSIAKFDVDGNGSREATAWTGPEDGILVYDLPADIKTVNADGQITSNKEINFLSWLVEEDTSNLTDLSALKKIFDSNKDNILSKLDENFDNFRIWKDTNSDGITQNAELSSLNDAHVETINLSSQGNKFVLQDGTKIFGIGSYTRSDGSTY